MQLTPEDIATFIYCPYLKSINKTFKSISSGFSHFERCVIDSIKQAELHCLLKGTFLYPRKIITQWDKIWWPSVAENNINFKSAERFSVKASSIFNDYCKYDISGEPYLSAGIDIKSSNLLNKSILITNSDIIKVNIDYKKKNTHLILFGNIPKTSVEVVLDPIIRTILYSLYSFNKEIMSCSYVCIREKSEKVLITSTVLRHDDLIEIEKTLKFIETGIRTKVNYQNPYNCKGCNICQSN